MTLPVNVYGLKIGLSATRIHLSQEKLIYLRQKKCLELKNLVQVRNSLML